MVTGKSENHRDVTWKFLPRAEYACPQALSLLPKYLTRPSPASHFSRSKNHCTETSETFFFHPSPARSRLNIPHTDVLSSRKVPPPLQISLFFLSFPLFPLFSVFLSKPAVSRPICRPKALPSPSFHFQPSSGG